MAENVFAVTQSDIRNRGASSGRLLPNHEVRIVSDPGDALADSHVGEILVKSDCLFEGYYNRPDLTALATAGDWYRTGDLGFCLDCELYVVGRKKDLLIIGGENIYPQDIEEIVAGHPEIHDGRVVAMGVYNPDLGTEDIVVVAEVAREERLANALEIEQEARSRVVAGLGVAVRAIFLKPPKWIVKSAAGKAARSATREGTIARTSRTQRRAVGEQPSYDSRSATDDWPHLASDPKAWSLDRRKHSPGFFRTHRLDGSRGPAVETRRPHPDAYSCWKGPTERSGHGNENVCDRAARGQT